MTVFDVKQYLDRIHYDGPLSINARTLRDLQQAHMRNVPYENLSIMAGQTLCLDEDALYDKIVIRGYGGFCYELNLSFAHLLREIGFPVQVIYMRIAKTDGSFGPPFDHIGLIVRLAEHVWLVDAGNSRWFDMPLQLDCADYQVRNHITYRLECTRDVYALYQRSDKEAEPDVLQYVFTLQEVRAEGFKPLCYYKNKSPNSNFTKGRICSRVTENGRLTLAERLGPDGKPNEWRLITVNKGVREDQPLASEAEFSAILRDQFGFQKR